MMLGDATQQQLSQSELKALPKQCIAGGVSWEKPRKTMTRRLVWPALTARDMLAPQHGDQHSHYVDDVMTIDGASAPSRRMPMIPQHLGSAKLCPHAWQFRAKPPLSRLRLRPRIALPRRSAR